MRLGSCMYDVTRVFPSQKSQNRSHIFHFSLLHDDTHKTSKWKRTTTRLDDKIVSTQEFFRRNSSLEVRVMTTVSLMSTSPSCMIANNSNVIYRNEIRQSRRLIFKDLKLATVCPGSLFKIMRSLFTDLVHGFVASSLIILLTVILESFCPEEIEKLLHKKGGKELYRQAIVANLVNVSFFGTLAYFVTVVYFCHPGPLTLTEQIRGACGVVIIEGLLFYLVHKAFHEVKGLYWAHSFHHRFNEVILPSSASAVSVTEFVVAYMMPIIFACAVVPNDRASAVLGSAIIGITNLLIHSPFMVGTKYHWAFVTPDDHFRHHRLLKTTYGAPVLSFDRVFNMSNEKPLKDVL